MFFNHWWFSENGAFQCPFYTKFTFTCIQQIFEWLLWIPVPGIKARICAIRKWWIGYMKKFSTVSQIILLSSFSAAHLVCICCLCLMSQIRYLTYLIWMMLWSCVRGSFKLLFLLVLGIEPRVFALSYIPSLFIF